MIEGMPRTRFAFAELALWTGAAVVALAAHAGAVAYMLRTPPMEFADNAPPAAIMIELAAEPEAIDTSENQIVPDMEDSAEVKSAEVEPPKEPPVEPPPEPVPEPVAEPTPEPVPEPEPQPEPVEEAEVPPEPVEEIDPIEQMALAQLENVEVPLPMARPRPPAKPKPQVREQQQAAAPAKRRAMADVKQSNRVAASQTSNSSGGSSVSPARWQSRLMSHLERRKRYPSGSRKNREEGTAMVRFTIDNTGNVLAVSLSRSSGYPALDQAVLDMVRRASPVPAPPPGVNKTIVAPVRFNLR